MGRATAPKEVWENQKIGPQPYKTRFYIALPPGLVVVYDCLLIYGSWLTANILNPSHRDNSEKRLGTSLLPCTLEIDHLSLYVLFFHFRGYPENCFLQMWSQVRASNPAGIFVYNLRKVKRQISWWTSRSLNWEKKQKKHELKRSIIWKSYIAITKQAKFRYQLLKFSRVPRER